MRAHRIIVLLPLLLVLAGCVTDTRHVLLISTSDQEMLVLRDNIKIAQYPVSTSKFGVGDGPHSNATPIGLLKIRKKIGAQAPPGDHLDRLRVAVGLEPRNRNAFGRYIYIHGTPEERNIGVASSYGCIRMRSEDVIALYDTVGTGARVLITTQPFKRSEAIR